MKRIRLLATAVANFLAILPTAGMTGCSADFNPAEPAERQNSLLAPVDTFSTMFPFQLTYALGMGSLNVKGSDVPENGGGELGIIADAAVNIGANGPVNNQSWTTISRRNWYNQSTWHSAELWNLSTYPEVCRVHSLDLFNLQGRPLRFDNGLTSMSTLLAYAADPDEPVRVAALNLLGSCSVGTAQRQEVAAGLGLRAEYAQLLQFAHTLVMDGTTSFTNDDVIDMEIVLGNLPWPISLIVHRVVSRVTGGPGLGSAGSGMIILGLHDDGPDARVSIPYPDGTTVRGIRFFEHIFLHEIGHLVDEGTASTWEHDRWVNLYNAGQGDPDAFCTADPGDAYEDFAAFWGAYFNDTAALIEQARRRTSSIFRQKVAHIVDVISHLSKTSTPAYIADSAGDLLWADNFPVERASPEINGDDGRVISVNGVSLAP